MTRVGHCLDRVASRFVTVVADKKRTVGNADFTIPALIGAMDTPDAEAAQAAKEVSLLWLGAALAYAVVAASTIHLTSNGRDIASIWPPNAILVALLLADARPRWRTILSAGFMGNIAANLVMRGASIGPMLYGAANMAEVAIVVLLLRRQPDQTMLLDSPAAAMRFICVAGLIAPGVSGSLGGLTAYLVYDEPLSSSTLAWVAADGLGLLIFTPLFRAMIQGDFVAYVHRGSWRARGEALGLLALLGTVASWAFFNSSRPLLFAIFPPLMLVTFRVGSLGTMLGVTLIGVIGGLATMHGFGPITLLAPDPIRQALYFQLFLAATLLTSLPAAAEVTSRDRRTEMLSRRNREMAIAALRDPLTGALNRAGLEAEVGRLLQMASTMTISTVAIDFDHFKVINDRWGHKAGDLALQHVTALLLSHVRSQDLVARVGGDEFVVLLPNSDLDLATSIANRIRAGVNGSPLSIDQTQIVLISLSLGVATSRPGEGYEDVMLRADRALYAAKEAGRNRLSLAS